VTVKVHDAGAHLPRLLARVLTGEEVVITAAGRPIAKRVPVVATGRPTPGSARGQIIVAPDGGEPLPDDVHGEFAH